MPTYVALLRGINVGGKNRVSMSALRDELEAEGFGDVATYVQSGNVVLASAQPRAKVAQAVHDAVAKTAGLDVVVMVRTHAELDRIVGDNPFLRRAKEPARQLHVAFLPSKPPAGKVKALDPGAFPPDEVRVAGNNAYAYCPNGVGRSKLFTVLERTLGMASTVRNWRTVTELHRMSGS